MLAIFRHKMEPGKISFPTSLIPLGRGAVRPVLDQNHAASQTDVGIQQNFPLKVSNTECETRGTQTRGLCKCGTKTLAPFKSPARRTNAKTPTSSSSSSSSFTSLPPTKQNSPSRTRRKKKRSNKWRRAKKFLSAASGTLVCDEKVTAYRRERIDEASAVLDALQPYIDQLP